MFFVFLLFPKLSSAATLFLSPSSGTYGASDKISVSVKVNTEGQSVNAIDGTIGFNPGNLEVLNVSKGPIVNLWVQEPSYSNKTGSVNFGGVVLNPGYIGSSGNILTIVFMAKEEGKADVNFKAGSVLANDGYGTNVLKAMNGATFNIGAEGVQQSQSSVVAGLEISSSTHPDQNKWYSNNDPVFQFKFPSDARELNLVLSRKEASTPQIKYAPPISEKILEDVDEGIWYLHANYRDKSGLSQTLAYKFQIDTGLPENFRVSKKNPNDTINPSPRYELSADDGMSGIDRYEAKIDGGEWITLSADDSGNYALPLQTPGKKLLTLRAYDKAGNYIESSQELQIDAPVKPAWYLGFEPLLKTLSKGFDAIINFIINRWSLLIVLLVAGAAIGQIIIKGVPHFAAEIRKIRFIASEYHAQKKLKKLDSKTKIEFKILQKDIKQELELLSKIAGHRSLHPDEQYLKNKLTKYLALLKFLK